jgi:hypothetical protein
MSLTLCKKHSWYNKRTHIFRTDGRVVRAVLKELVFDVHGIYIKAQFSYNGRRCCKHVCPITVAALQVMWVNVDVVSDIEFECDDENGTFQAPPECEQISHQLSIDDECDLDENQRTAFKCLTLSILNICNVTQSESINDLSV